jgi:uncharacterized repeat protein (TIGR03806 family)
LRPAGWIGAVCTVLAGACSFSDQGLPSSARVITPSADRSRPIIDPVRCRDCGLDARPVNVSCRAVPPPPELAEAVLAFPDLPPVTEPVMVLRHPLEPQWVLVERRGVLSRFDDRPGASRLTRILDIQSQVDPRGDAGLAAAAFDPAFARNGRLYLSYTAFGGTITLSRVARFTSPDLGRSFDPTSRQVLLEIDQAHDERIHLNADMKFGPDGFLYVGFGDGGPQGDPSGNAQNLDDLRGKILRLDVSPAQGYTIPPGNPLAGPEPAREPGHQNNRAGPGGRPEIFAWGLRNPWRFSFDPDSGKLWVGDVGFVNWEEIDLVSAGDNLGWPLLEGNLCLTAEGCENQALVPPASTYSHDSWDQAVVGGFVYRGWALPRLRGRYIFGDYVTGDVWALTDQGEPELVARTGLRIVSFAEDLSGEPLLVDFGSGQLFRLRAQVPPSASLPWLLSDTGCFNKIDPRLPVDGLIPYDVRIPFWSDGAAKRRFLALPPGESAQIRPDGSIHFPVGSVLAKQFFLDRRLVETRLMMKHREGQWTGATYAWDADQRDARLVDDGEALTAEVGGVPWRFPDRPACLGCHNADRSLGMEVQQLDLERGFPETLRAANQLDTFRRVGILEGDVPLLPRMPRRGEGTLAERARAYLHVNCAICHVRNGPTPVDMDLRFGTPLADMRICDVVPKEGDLGIPDARRLTPGAPAGSLLLQRMHASGPEHMPPIGPQLVDQAGAALVEAWIASLTRCP